MNLDLEAAGYKKYQGSTHLKNEDYYLAKSFDDDIGRRYQIVFYVYDWSDETKYAGRVGLPTSYMPEIYYRLDDNVSVYHTFAGHNDSITFVEMYADKMWQKLDNPYLRKWGE